MNQKKVAQLALDIGYHMLRSGAEIYRVEESIRYICSAYKLEEVDVFVIPATLILTVRTKDDTITLMRRLNRQIIHFDKVDKLNTLSRYITENAPDPDKANEELKKIIKMPYHSISMQLCGFALVGFFFTLFFGGSVVDAAFSLLLSVAICLVRHSMSRQQANSFFIQMVCGFVVTFPVQLLVKSGLFFQPDAVIIGALMNLVPGIAITNGIRDFIQGDLYGGMSKLVESLLIATFIAVGAGIPFLLLPYQAAPQAVSNGEWFPLIQLISAFIASCGFAICLEIRGRNLLWGALGGLVGWAVFLLSSIWTSSEFFKYFIAGFVIMLFSELFARLCKSPVTIFLVVSFIPLVPGGDAYRTMEFCVLGDFRSAASTCFHMLGVAGSIVVGVFFAGSVFKWVYSILKRGKKQEKV